MTTPPIDWVDVILGDDDATNTWKGIIDALRNIAVNSSQTGALDRATVVADRLLANSAWTLWNDFAAHAPTVTDGLKHFWVKTSAVGTAALILDGLSLREMPLIVRGASERGLAPTHVDVLASQVPTETDSFAESLGVAGRSRLFNNQKPNTFLFSGPDVFTDVLDAPFADCIGSVPTTPRVFLWHKWPDEPLIHLHADKEDGPEVVAAQTKHQLASDDFWSFIDRLRQGRRLIVTSDHGYAVSRFFSDELKEPDTVQMLRATFGAKRCAAESTAQPWQRRHLPPLVGRSGKKLVVLGQRKWPVQGGFPHLCHGGLSLLEAVVPFIEFPAK